MLQYPDPTDFVLATGRSASVKDFAELAARQVGFDLVWVEKGGVLQGQDRRSGIPLVDVDRALRRPSDINCIVGDASKAKRELDWQSKTSLEELVAMMVEADIRRIGAGLL